MTPIAEKFIAEAKAQGEDSPRMAFLIVTESEGLTRRLRGMMLMTALAPAGDVAVDPKLMIVDIPDDGAYFEGMEVTVTQATVQKFVDAYLAKTLERKQLS